MFGGLKFDGCLNVWMVECSKGLDAWMITCLCFECLNVWLLEYWNVWTFWIMNVQLNVWTFEMFEYLDAAPQDQDAWKITCLSFECLNVWMSNVWIFKWLNECGLDAAPQDAYSYILDCWTLGCWMSECLNVLDNACSTECLNIWKCLNLWKCLNTWMQHRKTKVSTVPAPGASRADSSDEGTRKKNIQVHPK